MVNILKGNTYWEFQRELEKRLTQIIKRYKAFHVRGGLKPAYYWTNKHFALFASFCIRNDIFNLLH